MDRFIFEQIKTIKLMNQPIFVTAIGTGCGKTVCSAILTEALKADYWKPIQAGTEEIDRETVASLISNKVSKLHPERYILKTPASPHAAAEIEGIQIKLSDFELPKTKNKLIIEGAGGVMVPLNYKCDFVIDLAQKFDAEIVLVSNLYLGSINHTLLTVNELNRRGLSIKGIIFNGNSTPASEKVIEKYTGLKVLLRVPQLKEISKIQIKSLAGEINWS
ncbi:MAG: dethiobiotin synthase [Bacteroidota bacterium]|nr:dethiobiotin synthase [Bacteroidota bacterium]